MNPVVLLALLTCLFVSLFAIIPKYAPANQQAIIQDWVGMGFNAILFGIVLYESRLKYVNVYYAIGFFGIALVVALSGVYWWIPKYIPKEKQSDAIKTMFTSLSVAILLTNIFSNAVPVGYRPYNDLGGGRRR